MRDLVLRGATITGVLVVIFTEGLGALSLLTRPWLAAVWLATGLGGAVWLPRRSRPSWTRPPFDFLTILCLAAIGAVLAATFVTAICSPPNSADAMAYHLPRVVYWAQQASVRFFPTPYLNQIMLAPFAEYAMLHTYVLTGGSDALVNLGQWVASLVSIIAASSIARLLTLPARGQAVAALFCATLPSGVLASSGAKNDYVLAMWLACAVYFTWLWAARRRLADACLAGAALGLALLTKATAYLFAPWVLGAVVLLRVPAGRRAVSGAVAALGVALLLNAPMYRRNVELSGSPLGFDSAQGDGIYRWRNESFGWRQTLSNALRNGAEQAGGRSEQRNRAVYQAVVDAHRRLGLDVNDPATTWRHARFAPPRNANHEADAPNSWHLALLVLAVGAAAWGRRDAAAVVYAVALVCGFVAFCAYLKWQPFQARLFLPLFVLSTPLAGVYGAWRSRAGRMGALAVCLFLLDNAKRPALDNWVRPLRGPRSVLTQPRAEQYFADMSQWNNAESYRQVAGYLAAGPPCRTIGLDVTNLQLEYPLQALLTQRSPEVRFVHTGVTNASTRYQQPAAGAPCVVVCFACDIDPRRQELYHAFKDRRVFGQFVVFR